MNPKYEEARELIAEHIVASHRTGSSYICDPPVLDTDRDYIILVSDLNTVLKICNETEGVEVSGWYAHNADEDVVRAAAVDEINNPPRDPIVEADGMVRFNFGDPPRTGAPAAAQKQPTHSNFVSVRMGEDNLLFTQKKEFYDKFVLATQLAKRFNLLVKQDRIDLFEAVLYGKLKGTK